MLNGVIANDEEPDVGPREADSIVRRADRDGDNWRRELRKIGFAPGRGEMRTSKRGLDGGEEG